MRSRGQRKYRKPLCAKCSDQGYMTAFEHPGRKHKVGMIRRIPCPKNCVATREWQARDAKDSQ